MILGVGIDVIEVARIGDLIARHGVRFLRHVFTAGEQGGAPESAVAAAACYAGRWCAKEAGAKALGTGIGADCQWHDIEVVRWPSGQPAVCLHGKGAVTAGRLGVRRVHVTISHERNLACASVVTEG